MFEIILNSIPKLAENTISEEIIKTKFLLKCKSENKEFEWNKIRGYIYNFEIPTEQENFAHLSK